WTAGGIFTYQTSAPFYVTAGGCTTTSPARSTFNSFNTTGGLCSSAQLGSLTFEQFKDSLGVFRTPVGVFFLNPSLLNVATGPNATTGLTELKSARLKDGLFVQPAPGKLGNFPQNSLFGPNFTQTDFTLAKRTYFSERGNVEFRMIAFNIFNHPNFVIGNQS